MRHVMVVPGLICLGCTPVETRDLALLDLQPVDVVTPNLPDVPERSVQQLIGLPQIDVMPSETAPGPESVLQTSGVIDCGEPALRKARKFERSSLQGVPPALYRMYGAGAAAGDFTGDGLKDVLLLGTEDLFFLVQGPSGVWTDMPERLPEHLIRDSFGVSVADIEDDGDLDIFIAGFESPDLLLLNDGMGYFEEVAEERGIDVSDRSSSSSSWGDYDRDGDLDLVVGGYSDILEDGTLLDDLPGADDTILYANDGTGHFTDERYLIPAAGDHRDRTNVQAGYTFLATFVHVDSDAYPEIYLVNDVGHSFSPGRMLWNDKGRGFEVDDGSLGLDLIAPGMGLGIGDLNGDERPDFVVSAWGRMLTLSSTLGGAVWVNRTNAIGVVPNTEEPYNQVVGWGVEVADVDNDLDLDIATLFGRLDTHHADENPAVQTDALWLEDADGNYIDVSASWDFDDGTSGRGVIATDLNDDGYVDFVKASTDGQHRLLTSVCGHASWLRVQLRQPAPNVRAVGASVRVYLDEDNMLTRMMLGGGTGFATGYEPEVHFGLADYETLSKVEVRWPDGLITSHEDIATKQVLTITRL